MLRAIQVDQIFVVYSIRSANNNMQAADCADKHLHLLIKHTKDRVSETLQTILLDIDRLETCHILDSALTCLACTQSNASSIHADTLCVTAKLL